MDNRQKEQELLLEIRGFLLREPSTWGDDLERATDLVFEYGELGLKADEASPDYQRFSIVVNEQRCLKWMESATSLLEKYWGDLEAFDVKEIPVENEHGFDWNRCVPGPAADEANHLLAIFEDLDRPQDSAINLLGFQYIKDTLEDHVDPSREYINIRRTRLAEDFPRYKGLLKPYEPIKGFEPLEDFKALLEHYLNNWGFWYKVPIDKYGNEKGERIYLSIKDSLKRHLKEQAGELTEGEEGTTTVKCVPFSELINDLYDAVVEEDENKEMALRAELYATFRIREQNLDNKLFNLLQRKALGFKPSQRQKQKRRGVSLRKITGTEWKLPGFLPANDISLLWGVRGAGKTRLALEMAIQLMKGLGLLDRSTKADPSKVLFIASDSGGDPLKEELQEMGFDADGDPLFHEDGLFELWCYSQEEQQSAWGCGIRGRIELFEWSKANQGSVVVMDSAKAITAKGGCDYTDNATVTEFMTFLKEVICPYVTVLVVAHDGTRSDRAGGAAAWEEIPSMVMSARKPKGEDGQEESARRLFTVHKCRKADERSFFYTIDETGRLKTCMGAEHIGDLRTQIFDWAVKQKDAGKASVTTDEIVEGIRSQRFMITKKAVQNNLSSLIRGKTPRLQRVPGKKGTFRVNPYWLRSNR